MRGWRVLQRCEDVGGANQGRAGGGRGESLKTTEVRHWKTWQKGESYMCLPSRDKMQSSTAYSPTRIDSSYFPLLVPGTRRQRAGSMRSLRDDGSVSCSISPANARHLEVASMRLGIDAGRGGDAGSGPASACESTVMGQAKGLTARTVRQLRAGMREGITVLMLMSRRILIAVQDRDSQSGGAERDRLTSPLPRRPLLRATQPNDDSCSQICIWGERRCEGCDANVNASSRKLNAHTPASMRGRRPEAAAIARTRVATRQASSSMSRRQSKPGTGSSDVRCKS